MLAARATGVSTPKIIFRHIVPNALGPVIVYATLTIPSVMLQEAFLSFLGLGVQAPYASWGSLAQEGIQNIAVFPWQLIFPGVTMALTLFSLNFLGDGLRDALDPQMRNSREVLVFGLCFFPRHLKPITRTTDGPTATFFQSRLLIFETETDVRAVTHQLLTDGARLWVNGERGRVIGTNLRSSASPSPGQESRRMLFHGRNSSRRTRCGRFAASASA